MGDLSIWHWLVLLVVVFGLWLVGRVLRKAGYSPWWALLTVVPVVNIICWWVFAFASWPRDRKSL